MILVLLGTQNNDFHRLLEEIDKNIENGNINEDVIVQAGYTRYHSNNMKIFKMTSSNELEKLIDSAELIITHAGLGSIEMSLKKGKKVIAVPRKKIYGEHVNNHQEDIEKEFNDKGYIVGIDNVEKLSDALNRVKEFVPIKYIPVNNKKMVEIVKTFIDKV